MGTRQQLDRLQAKLWQGPRAARVDAVDERESESVSGYTTFRIEGTL